MSRHTVAVVIPVYKEEISSSEMLSLKQCLKVLGHYPIVFAGPATLNYQPYLNLCASDDYSIVQFEERYFKNIDGYNQLMLSPNFYKAFLNYRFILIYQLDAYVFRDELMYWCKQGYDYIGAPHVVHQNQAGEMQFLKNYSSFLTQIKKVFPIKHQVSNVGNGGLSLRKTRSFYWLLRALRGQVKKWGTNNEDGFFKYWGNLLYPFFRLPDDETALKFSVETEPAVALNRLNHQLPFGCHAFEKYDWEAWKPYILESV